MGGRAGALHHLVQLHQSLVCFGCSSSLKLQSPLWDRAPLASQPSPSHPRQRSRRAWLVYWLWMSSDYKILRSADPSSKFPVCGKEAGWYRPTIQVIRSLFGWIVVFSNASSVKLSSVGLRVAMEGIVGGLDGNSMMVRLRSMKQLRLRDGICVRICLPGGAPLS